jgi:hypothetical protein
VKPPIQLPPGARYSYGDLGLAALALLPTVDLGEEAIDPRRCQAISKESGRQCRHAPTPGEDTCRKHRPR